MARFYSTFSGTEGGQPSSKSAGYYATYRAMTGATTLKTNLLAARAALSAQVYAQLDAANRTGVTGLVIASDGFTRGGGTLSWSNLYTNTGAVWPGAGNAAYKTRPLKTGITIANSTSPNGDAGSITETYYTDATTALEACLSACAGGGPRARYGNDPAATMATLWHDIDMTYIMWDDYTPGTPNTLSASYSLGTINPTPSTPITANVPITWKNEYYADREVTVYARYTLVRQGGGYSSSPVDVALTGVSYGAVSSDTTEFNGSGTIPVSMSVGTSGNPPDGAYDLNVQLFFNDNTYTSLYAATSYGALSSILTITNAVTIAWTV